MKECGHIEASDFLIVPRILYIGDSTVNVLPDSHPPGGYTRGFDSMSRSPYRGHCPFRILKDSGTLPRGPFFHTAQK